MANLFTIIKLLLFCGKTSGCLTLLLCFYLIQFSAHFIIVTSSRLKFQFIFLHSIFYYINVHKCHWTVCMQKGTEWKLLWIQRNRKKSFERKVYVLSMYISIERNCSILIETICCIHFHFYLPSPYFNIRRRVNVIMSI